MRIFHQVDIPSSLGLVQVVHPLVQVVHLPALVVRPLARVVQLLYQRGIFKDFFNLFSSFCYLFSLCTNFCDFCTDFFSSGYNLFSCCSHRLKHCSVSAVNSTRCCCLACRLSLKESLTGRNFLIAASRYRVNLVICASPTSAIYIKLIQLIHR